MTPVGDVASCAAAGATLGRLAHGLRVDARRVAGAYAETGRSWSGPAAATARRRGGDLVVALEEVAGELERGAEALRDHAVRLADLTDRGRRLEEEAAAHGLLLGANGPAPAPGIRGEADAVAAARLEAARATLGERWAGLLAESSAAAADLGIALDEARRGLAGAATALRSR